LQHKRSLSVGISLQKPHTQNGGLIAASWCGCGSSGFP